MIFGCLVVPSTAVTRMHLSVCEAVGMIYDSCGHRSVAADPSAHNLCKSNCASIPKHYPERRNLCSLQLIPAMPAQVVLVEEILEAWLLTMERQGGIFDRSFDLQGFKHASNTGDSENLGDDSLFQAVSDIDEVQAHHLWVNFLLETWQVSLPIYCSLLLLV